MNFNVTKKIFATNLNSLYIANDKEHKDFKCWAIGDDCSVDFYVAWNKLHGHEIMINEDFSVADVKRIIDLYEQYKRKEKTSNSVC